MTPIEMDRLGGLRFFDDRKSQSGNGVDNDNDNDADASVFNSIECYACTQVGVPVFHSATCDRTDQPVWEASAGSSLLPIKARPKWKTVENCAAGGLESSRPFGGVLDPRSKSVQNWNRVILLARGMSLAVDPLFFFALSIGLHAGDAPCIYMDSGVVAVATVLRTCVDAVHLRHVWLQLRLAYVSKESLVVGCGKLVWDARAIASHYVRSLKGLWFDVFVILPVPQAVYWLVIPKLLREEQINLIMTTLQLIFLFQFLPKVYHCFSLTRRMRKVTGYIFGTIWWGFGLNLIAYFLVSHAAGGYWYFLSIQRIALCLSKQCDRSKNCSLSFPCSKEVCYRSFGNSCGFNSTTMVKTPLCLDNSGPFPFGIYQFALPLISSDSIIIKILYSNLWGLMSLSTMGNNLAPTSHWLELMFCICVVLGGLMLFTLLVGNIQVFLHAVMSRRRKAQQRYQDMEWWMRRRQLPSPLKNRVRHLEYQRWATMGGDEEMELIQDLPEGLRRDIKHFLCLDLIQKVPLFHNLDQLILDNICDRIKPLLFSKYEKIMREGDPVQLMVFIVHGRVKRSQSLRKGMVATSILEPGSFLGDELMSWCLRRPFIDRLPPSSATFTCVEPTEAFGLDANHLWYIADHFRYKFGNEKLKRTARFYSSNWRTWAAIKIQLAWRRCVMKTRRPVNHVMENGGDDQRRLRQYAAVFMSLRPPRRSFGTVMQQPTVPSL
ncbi:hypothetical protein F0562_004369 [Nyssa sinensis]|uniref:Cyclic nucleotide-binding domain-containing protein n=1 Tax=Nyssa sinensis TaxID=561372 RepID=A0A5J5C192_9ASTE|nr:hypothetical protein F0562_004369 [Nyssa sinensis]